MGSPAQAKYQAGASLAAHIRSAVADARLRPITRQQSQAFAHASLVALVAAWDSYLNELARNFYTETANPGDAAFRSIYEIARSESRRVGRRFNTPNWNNSRDFLVRTTGFDPISSWVWPARGMGALQVQERMNQILKVRHSFAHGSQIPSYSWNRSPTGRVRLNQTVLKETEGFFNNLVKRTDVGMKNYLRAVFGRHVPW